MTAIDFILIFSATEAIVELWKKAAPLQGARARIIRKTPFLFSRAQQTHLLECPYCTSVWVGFLVMSAFLFMDGTAFLWCAGSLTAHRLSNGCHLLYSIVRDLQIDIRVNRRK